MKLSQLEENIGYKYKDIDLLRRALTHSSYANEHKVKSYERLEFLGDSLLGYICAEYLYEHFPKMPEGELTKTRSSLVCEKSICVFSRELSVGEFMYLSNIYYFVKH